MLFMSTGHPLNMNNSTMTWEVYSPNLSYTRIVLQTTYLFLGNFVAVVLNFNIIREVWRERKWRSVGSFYFVNLATSWMLNVVSLSLEINLETFNEPVEDQGFILCYIYPVLIRIPGMAEALFLSSICMERSWNWRRKDESTEKRMVEYGLEAWGLIVFAEVYCFISSGKERIPLKKEHLFNCFVIMRNPKLQAFFMTMYITIRCFAMACIFFECWRGINLEGRRFVLEPSRPIEETPMELEYKWKELQMELTFIKMAFGSRLLLDFFDGTMLLGRTSFTGSVRETLEKIETYLRYGAFFRSSILPLTLIVMNSELREAIKERIINEYGSRCSREGLDADELVDKEDLMKADRMNCMGGREVERRVGEGRKDEDEMEIIVCEGDYEVEPIAGENSACSSEKERVQTEAFQPEKNAEDEARPEEEMLTKAGRWAAEWNAISPDETDDSICAYVARDEVEDSDSFSILETVSELYSYIRVPRVAVVSSGSPSLQSEFGVPTEQEFSSPDHEGDAFTEAIRREDIDVPQMGGETDVSTMREIPKSVQVKLKCSVCASHPPNISRKVQFEIPRITLSQQPRRNLRNTFESQFVRGSRTSRVPEVCGDTLNVEPTPCEDCLIMMETDEDRYATAGPLARPTDVGRHGRFLRTSVPSEMKELQDCAVRLARSVKEKYTGEWV